MRASACTPRTPTTIAIAASHPSGPSARPAVSSLEVCPTPALRPLRLGASSRRAGRCRTNLNGSSIRSRRRTVSADGRIQVPRFPRLRCQLSTSKTAANPMAEPTAAPAAIRKAGMSIANGPMMKLSSITSRPSGLSWPIELVTGRAATTPPTKPATAATQNLTPTAIGGRWSDSIFSV